MQKVIAVSLLSLLMFSGNVFGGLIFVDPGAANTTVGHPAKVWTAAEKKIVNEALDEWKAVIGMFEHHLGDWTLRWEDADFFKDWDIDGHPELDFSPPTRGVAVPTGSLSALNGEDGFDLKDFPEMEIYFLVDDDWFFDPTPEYDGNDAGEVPNDKFDFLTYAKHELGHALGIDGHLADGAGGALEGTIDSGERHRITKKDLDLIRSEGGELAKWLVPEPPINFILVIAILSIICRRYRNRILREKTTKWEEPR